MKFRTELSPAAIQPSLQFDDSVMILGSCFAENIGQRLLRGDMSVLINPLGIQYNPLSIEKNVRYFCGVESFDESELFENQGLIRHWDIHSRICKKTHKGTLEQVHAAIEQGHHFIQKANWLYLTFGTAHVWFRNDRPVGNCHKRPGGEFTRTILSLEECTASLQRIVYFIREINPDIGLVMTVSPVRYKRDGLIASQRSKSTLLLAIDQLCHNTEHAHYFPAYELFVDDLRDYRFCTSDLVHPSEMAINYIWNKFQQCAISSKAISHIQQAERKYRQNQHQPMHKQK